MIDCSQSKDDGWCIESHVMGKEAFEVKAPACTLTDTVIWLKNKAIHNEQCDELIYSTANYYY